MNKWSTKGRFCAAKLRAWNVKANSKKHEEQVATEGRFCIAKLRYGYANNITPTVTEPDPTPVVPEPDTGSGNNGNGNGKGNGKENSNKKSSKTGTGQDKNKDQDPDTDGNNGQGNNGNNGNGNNGNGNSGEETTAPNKTDVISKDFKKHVERVATKGRFCVAKLRVVDYTSDTFNVLLEVENIQEGLTYRTVYGYNKISVQMYDVTNGAGSIVDDGAVKLYTHMV